MGLRGFGWGLPFKFQRNLPRCEGAGRDIEPISAELPPVVRPQAALASAHTYSPWPRRGPSALRSVLSKVLAPATPLLNKMPSPIEALRQIAAQAINVSPEESERQTREHLARIWKERAAKEAARDPSLATIPRFYVPKSKAGGAASAPAAAASTQQLLQTELSRQARERLREHLASLILEPHELERLWQLLRQHASPPRIAADERINYDDFCQVAAAMPPRCRKALFAPSHFLKFRPDAHGRISLLHFFQWTRRKNSLMQTRAELSMFDATSDGWLAERELEQWIGALIPTLPALADLREEFFPFYKVTAVRKFLFFLDPRRRGRVQIKQMLASPVTHELLELRRLDLQADELRHNWFSLPYAEMLYADYLEPTRPERPLSASSPALPRRWADQRLRPAHLSGVPDLPQPRRARARSTTSLP